MSNEVATTLTVNDNLTPKLGDAEKSIAAFGNRVTGVFKAIAAAWVVKEGFGLVSQMVKDAAAAELAQNKLNGVIAATGGVVGYTGDQLADMAMEMRRITAYDDDAIKGAMTLMATFKNIRGDVFKDATASILDMATVMGGDLNGAAMQVSKALNDPLVGITALSRAGVTFSSQQKKMIADMIAANDVMGAQRVILGELSSEFGGVAASATDTAGGRFKQLQLNIDDLAESIGTMLLPYVDQLVAKLNEAETSSDNVSNAASGSSSVFGVLADTVEAFGLIVYSVWTVLKGMFADFLWDAAFAATAMEKLGMVSKSTADAINEAWKEAHKSAQMSQADVKAGWLALSPSQKAKGTTVGGSAGGASGINPATGQPYTVTNPAEDEAEKKRVDAEKELIDLQKQRQTAAEKLSESLQTPIEKFYAEQAKLDEMLARSQRGESGGIDADTYGRAIKKAYDDFLKDDPVSKAWTDAATQATQIIEKNMTPWEKMMTEMQKLDQLRNAAISNPGAVNFSEFDYAREKKRVQGEFDKSDPDKKKAEEDKKRAKEIADGSKTELDKYNEGIAEVDRLSKLKEGGLTTDQAAKAKEKISLDLLSADKGGSGGFNASIVDASSMWNQMQSGFASTGNDPQVKIVRATEKAAVEAEKQTKLLEEIKKQKGGFGK
jgi:hypothetical protein